MRDSHAAAMPLETRADPPETILPYDPDDWDRRLAEARKRRETVLQRRGGPEAAGMPQGGAAMTAHQARIRGVPSARDAGPPGGNAQGPDPADWRRRLAEARGLNDDVGPRARPGAIPSDAVRAPAAPPVAAAAQRPPETGTNGPTPPATPTGTAIADWHAPATTSPVLTPLSAPSAAHPAALNMPRSLSRAMAGTADPDRTGALRGHAPSLRAAPGRVAMLAGLAGLAAGVALSAMLLGPRAPTPVPVGPGASVSAHVSATSDTATTVPSVTPLPWHPADHAAVPVLAPPLPALPAPGIPHATDAPARNAVPVRPPAPVVPAALVPMPVPARTPPPLPVGGITADPQPAMAMAIPRSDAAPATSDNTTATAPDTFVVVHVPQRPDAGASGPVLAVTRAEGWTTVPIAFTVRRSHLRVYHDADRAAAAALGDRLGLPLRDFTGSAPAPEGLIELWIAGGPASAE